MISTAVLSGSWLSSGQTKRERGGREFDSSLPLEMAVSLCRDDSAAVSTADPASKRVGDYAPPELLPPVAGVSDEKVPATPVTVKVGFVVSAVLNTTQDGIPLYDHLHWLAYPASNS